MTCVHTGPGTRSERRRGSRPPDAAAEQLDHAGSARAPRRRRRARRPRPLRRSAAAISTGRTRGAPSSVFSANARPSGSATRVAGLGAGLADRPGQRGQQGALVAAVPDTHSGWRRIAPATRASGPSGAVASRAKARASPVSEAESSGAPQPSTATAATGSPVSSAKVSAIACCSGWSGSRYVASVPAVERAGDEHRGVLARAVHRDRVLGHRRPGSSPRAPRRRAGSPGGVCSARSSMPADGQDPAYAVEVERLPGVRGAHQREQLVGQVQAEPDHRQRLDRLVARPRQDRYVDRARRTSRRVRRRPAPRPSRSGGPRRTRSARCRPLPAGMPCNAE